MLRARTAALCRQAGGWSGAAAPCGATRSGDAAALLPPRGYPRKVQPSTIPCHHQSCSSGSPVALGLEQQQAVPRDLPGLEQPPEDTEGHPLPAEAVRASCTSPAWWARRSWGQSWGPWEKDRAGTGQSPARCASETIPCSRPQAPSQSCGNEPKRGGRVREQSRGRAGASSGSHMCRGC